MVTIIFQLGMIIQKTPKRTLANFLIFHFIDVMTTDLANATKACKEVGKLVR